MPGFVQPGAELQRYAAGRLAKRGDEDELRARADAGDEVAAVRLAEMLAERGDQDGAVQLLYTLLGANIRPVPVTWDDRRGTVVRHDGQLVLVPHKFICRGWQSRASARTGSGTRS
jgi:hypothetical protein